MQVDESILVHNVLNLVSNSVEQSSMSEKQYPIKAKTNIIWKVFIWLINKFFLEYIFKIKPEIFNFLWFNFKKNSMKVNNI